jgi:hypothetical protein
MPPTMRADFTEMFEDLSAYLSSVSWLEYAEHPDEYSVFGNVKTSDQMQEEDFMVAELGQFAVKSEGAPIAVDAISPSFSKTFLHLTYAKGVEVTMEALEDDKHGVMMDQAAALGYGARQTVETLAANEWFNNAFTTATSADGAAIYASHTTSEGFTIDNSAVTDLDVAGVEAGLTHFADLVSEVWNKIRMQAVNLIVPPALQYQAYELTESLQRPDTANNATNALRRFGLNVVVGHYMNSNTAWFMWGDPRMIKAKWYWRKQPTPVRDTRYSNQSGLSGLLFRSSVGVSDYRGLYGSNPA